MANHAVPSTMGSLGEILKQKTLESNRQKVARAKTERVGAEGMALEREQVTVLQVMVTVAVATEWLKRNADNNRPISGKTVDRYGTDMKAGHWDVNGEPIKFTKAGVLIDGQHRLNACLKYGVPFETIVVLGLEKRAMRTLDCGLVRRPGDVLAMVRTDIRKSHKTASVLNLVWRYEKGRLLSKTIPTRDEMLDCLERHPSVVDSIEATVANRLAPGPMLAFCHYLFSTIDKTLTEVFFNAMETGTNLNGNEPVFLLRERLANNRAARAKLSHVEIMALIFKAWRATREGIKVKTLRWNVTGGEDFPQVE